MVNIFCQNYRKKVHGVAMIVGFLIGINCLLSCQKKEGLFTLSEEQLIGIITDMHASVAMSKNFPVVERDSILEVYYQQILEIHEVEQTVFEKDFKLLKRTPVELEKMYLKIEKKLEEQKEKSFGESNQMEKK